MFGSVPGAPKGSEEERKGEESEEEQVAALATKNSNRKGKAKGKGKKVASQTRRGLRSLQGASGRGLAWGTSVWDLVSWGHGVP